MTAGTALIMWLGELITQRGVGNGMSILIFTSIISRLPAEGERRSSRPGGLAPFVVLMGIGIVIIVASSSWTRASGAIPIQYAKRVVGPEDDDGRVAPTCRSR